MPADLLNRKKTHFVLWLPGDKQPTPTLYISRFLPSESLEIKKFELSLSEGFTDLWEIAASKCELKDGQVYFY